MTEGKTIKEIISSHEIRDASLRRVFMEKKVDLTDNRIIECHFWIWSQENAVRLGKALKNRGFEILIQRPASIAGDPNRWNLEASVRQSINLTMRREFIEELVRLADSHDGLYDGWGTSI